MNNTFIAEIFNTFDDNLFYQMNMLTIDPKTSATAKIHGILLGAVAPRPIAFASTVDKNGNPNLSPFSFFNAFGANPPTLVFSPARRVRDNTTKHTLDNILETGEVVINVVSYSMVQQTSLASTEYPDGVNEFEKAGFTAIPSEIVKPFRVKESPVQMECIVKQVIPMGDQGGAGNLVICEVVLFHINEEILDENGRIDQQKIDLVARLGGDFYCRASGSTLFEVPKPLSTMGIGVDSIPANIRFSKILTGNDLGMLGNVEQLPDGNKIQAYIQESGYSKLISEVKPEEQESFTHKHAHQLIESGKVNEAWKVLLFKK